MSLFVIGDLHLSLSTKKPMDIFEGWSDYVPRIEKNWRKLVTDKDTVVVPGDISWALKLEECFQDFQFIDNLPGKKIFLKGNHDLWWSTRKKVEEYLIKHNFSTISLLFNNSIPYGNYNLCGSRGWMFETGEEQDTKIIQREAGRLRRSLESGDKAKETIVFLHYPPIYREQEITEFTDILKEFNVKKCYYGHLHANSLNYALNGKVDGIDYRLVSADFLQFIPKIIL